MNGLLIAASSSGAGKTMITLGLLRALHERGVAITGAKSGPDFIDPAFHEAACGTPSVNLDAWAMSADALRSLANTQSGETLLIEGAMGLFDGAPDGSGSAADLAATLGVPIVLVLDVARQSQTAAVIAHGLSAWRKDVRIAGVILNNVGSSRHAEVIWRAMEAANLPVIGAIPRAQELAAPSRHLGLVQAAETPELDAFIANAAKLISESVDLNALMALAATIKSPEVNVRSLAKAPNVVDMRPLGQRMSIAKDPAFAFIYPHLLRAWREAGAELTFFSPLADEAPSPDADAIYLPGGYPELFAEHLASAATFLAGMHSAAQRGALIYGECGGYMTLGEGLVDAEGIRHAMLGLLPVETSFAGPKLTLGYRRLRTATFPMGNAFTAHEFHYSAAHREDGEPLFETTDAEGNALAPMGRRAGNVMGSYAHIIDLA